jgi:hypothetical protein
VTAREFLKKTNLPEKYEPLIQAGLDAAFREGLLLEDGNEVVVPYFRRAFNPSALAPSKRNDFEAALQDLERFESDPPAAGIPSPRPQRREGDSSHNPKRPRRPRIRLDREARRWVGFDDHDLENWRKDFPKLDGQLEEALQESARWWVDALADGRKKSIRNPRAAIRNGLKFFVERQARAGANGGTGREEPTVQQAIAMRGRAPEGAS